jgi:hypothetical protein
MTTEIRTEGEKIYDELVNSKKGDYWMYATQEGLDCMIEVRKRLLALGNGVFSGYPERGWTWISNADKIDGLNNRIKRWEGDLKRETDIKDKAA